MKKFNIGDRVIITNQSHEYGGKYRGCTGVISLHPNVNYGVKLDGLYNDNSAYGCFYFCPDNIASLDKPDKILIGDMDHGYSFVSSEEFEKMRIEKELNENKNNKTSIHSGRYPWGSKEAEELRTKKELAKWIVKRMINSVYGVSSIQLGMPKIEKVIFNNPATIVFWSDGIKTVVKCGEESFDEEKGLAMAISKKVLGNKGNYYNEFKKWLPMDNSDSYYEYKNTGIDFVTSVNKAAEAVIKTTNALKKYKGDK